MGNKVFTNTFTMKFILNRTDDYRLHSKKWIVGYGLLFWVITKIIATVLLTCCMTAYNAFGINPGELTRFFGNPESAKGFGTLTYVILTLALGAPLFEEAIFRLGLSFKRWQIALGISAIPLYLMWQHAMKLTVATAILYPACAAVIFCVIYFLTSDRFWKEQKEMYYKAMIWVSAIAFGLVHLIAFSNYSAELIPYMLCVILMPFFAGCAMTYYRINLGFWWGLGMHIFNNIPGIIMTATMSSI